MDQVYSPCVVFFRFISQLFANQKLCLKACGFKFFLHHVWYFRELFCNGKIKSFNGFLQVQLGLSFLYRFD